MARTFSAWGEISYPIDIIYYIPLFLPEKCIVSLDFSKKPYPMDKAIENEALPNRRIFHPDGLSLFRQLLQDTGLHILHLLCGFLRYILMIVSGQMTYPMDQELAYALHGAHPGIGRLGLRPLNRNHDISKMRSLGADPLLLRKRDHIGRPVSVKICPVQLLYMGIIGEHNRKLRIGSAEDHECLLRPVTEKIVFYLEIILQVLDIYDYH